MEKAALEMRRPFQPTAATEPIEPSTGSMSDTGRVESRA
jgi:hypothetical protein